MIIELKSISASETLAFRQEMLWPDKPLSHVMVPGDETARHLGAFRDGVLIGCGSFFADGPRVQLRKLAVAPDHRGAGLGSRIIQHGARADFDHGSTYLWCDARQTALGFYERLGFVAEGPIFDKSGVAYRKAVLDLSKLFASG